MRSLLHDTTNITSVDCTTLHFNLIYKLLFLRFFSSYSSFGILHPFVLFISFSLGVNIIHTEYISIYAYWSQWIHTHNIHLCLEIGKKNWHLRFRSWGFTRICPAKLEKAHIYIYIYIFFFVTWCLVFKLIYIFKVNQTVFLRLTTFFRSTNSKFNVYPSWF